MQRLRAEEEAVAQVAFSLSSDTNLWQTAFSAATELAKLEGKASVSSAGPAGRDCTR